MNIVDMSGGEFGTWRVVDRTTSTRRGARWNCVCRECGHRAVYHGFVLRHDRPQCPACKDPRAKREELTARELRKLEGQRRPVPTPVAIEDDPGNPGRCSLCNQQSLFFSGRCKWCGRTGTMDASEHVRVG